jgi:hypothetical protein
VRPLQLQNLSSAGKGAISSKLALKLNVLRAPEVIMGPTLGDTAVREPLLEARKRQLRWLHLLTNMPGFVETVYRFFASIGGGWVEPSAALSAALSSVSLSLRRNVECLRAVAWPHLLPETSYAVELELQPVDSFPAELAVLADGLLANDVAEASWPGGDS